MELNFPGHGTIEEPRPWKTDRQALLSLYETRVSS